MEAGRSTNEINKKRILDFFIGDLGAARRRRVIGDGILVTGYGIWD